MVIQIIANTLLVIASIVLVVAVMLSPSKSSGLSSAFSGASAETFLGKNRAKTLEGKLGAVVKICSATVFVLALLLVLLLNYFG